MLQEAATFSARLEEMLSPAPEGFRDAETRNGPRRSVSTSVRTRECEERCGKKRKRETPSAFEREKRIGIVRQGLGEIPNRLRKAEESFEEELANALSEEEFHASKPHIATIAEDKELVDEHYRNLH